MWMMVVWMSLGRWLLYGANDMIIQLEWLRDALIEAESNGEKVHIVGHIPPNTSSCIRAWNRAFNKIIRHFANIISGQFNGHTHTDEFTLFYSESNADSNSDSNFDSNATNNNNSSMSAINVAWNGGSGTSFIGLNSNYRLYTIDAQTYEVIDHQTWIFNLTEANLNPHKTPIWFKEYSFRAAFGVNDLKPKTLSALVNNTFRHDKHALERVIGIVLYFSSLFPLPSQKQLFVFIIIICFVCCAFISVLAIQGEIGRCSIKEGMR